MERKEFGKMDDGQIVSLYELTNTNGVKLIVSDLGATLVNLWIPDKDRNLKDVVLGYDRLQPYLENTDTFFGATIGRNSNRVANSSFLLNGETIYLSKNEGENNLHSGPDGIQLRLWLLKEYNNSHNSLTFQLISPNGDQGFPGELTIEVTYTLTEMNEVKISYKGISNEDTIFNPTNHTYFNLNGHDSGTILNHKLKLVAQFYTPVDKNLIPTGELKSVVDTPFNFLKEKTIGMYLESDNDQLIITGGYDHNYSLDNENKKLIEVGSLSSDKTGIKMDISTTSLGVQLYSGNFIENENGKENIVYSKYAGLCLETQFFPNSVNQSKFNAPILPADTIQEYLTIYKFYNLN